MITISLLMSVIVDQRKMFLNVDKMKDVESNVVSLNVNFVIFSLNSSCIPMWTTSSVLQPEYFVNSLMTRKGQRSSNRKGQRLHSQNSCTRAMRLSVSVIYYICGYGWLFMDCENLC